MTTLSLIAVVSFVFLKNRRLNGQMPSAQFLAPYAAFYLWWVPLFFQPEFFFSAVPFFHSFQYLAFVYKIEKRKAERAPPRASAIRGPLVYFSLVVVGFLAFELVPNSLDSFLGTQTSLQTWFFFICGQVLINVHHYFIDNVIWRFDQPEMRELFTSQESPATFERAA